jgi:hypothetical protein
MRGRTATNRSDTFLSGANGVSLQSGVLIEILYGAITNGKAGRLVARDDDVLDPPVDHDAQCDLGRMRRLAERK